MPFVPFLFSFHFFPCESPVSRAYSCVFLVSDSRLTDSAIDCKHMQISHLSSRRPAVQMRSLRSPSPPFYYYFFFFYLFSSLFCDCIAELRFPYSNATESLPLLAHRSPRDCLRVAVCARRKRVRHIGRSLSLSGDAKRGQSTTRHSPDFGPRHARGKSERSLLTSQTAINSPFNIIIRM